MYIVLSSTFGHLYTSVYIQLRCVRLHLCVHKSTRARMNTDMSTRQIHIVSYDSVHCKMSPPPPNQIYFQNWYPFSMLKLTKFPPPFEGWFHIFLHKPRHEEVHSARSSCTAPERVWKRFEFGWKQNRICFADTLRWKSHSFLSEAGSARFEKVTMTCVYGMDFFRNKGKSYLILEWISLGDGGHLHHLIWSYKSSSSVGCVNTICNRENPTWNPLEDLVWYS